MVSRNGIGVFAIRDIPAGTNLFVGDTLRVVAVPALKVESIPEDGIRQMYIDFCPVVDGNYMAPADFNQMTMSWYLNHSPEPNVIVLSDLNLVASTFIAKGEELRTDYTTYSDRASRHITSWR